MDSAPQTERLIRRIDELETPVVQVWGWPGSGRAALLRALLEHGGDEARALAPADLDPDSVREAVAAGARWLVVPSLPADDDPTARLTALARVLPADRRLVFATRRRVAVPDLLCGLVTPRDLALTAPEVMALVRRAGAEAPGPADAARMACAADGWYRPLRLAAAAAARGEPPGRLPSDPERLAELPAVADFLRSAVLADLTAEERAALARPAAATPATLRRLRDELGLLVDDAEGLRPLHLLAAAARRDGAAAGRVPSADAALDATSGPASDPRSGPAPKGPEDLPPEIRYRVHLLGPPEVWRRTADGGWRRLHWPLKRAFRALAYLASSPERRAAREELVEALWPAAEPETVRRNFHPTLSHLRRGLRDGAGDAEAPPLRLADGVYSLAPELGWWTDLEGLEALAGEGRELAAADRDAEAVAAWEAAWRLYRGDFLEGDYEPWAVERRDEHQRRYLLLLEDLAAARERLGRLGEAVDAYRAVLVEDPLQERAHGALMRLYARRGRRDLVRRQYERLTALLREELGIEPLPETTEEYHRLMTVRG